MTIIKDALNTAGDAWNTVKKPFNKGLGGLASKLYGSENDFTSKAPPLDPNAYQYGHTPGGADETANRYRQQAEDAQQRQGVQVDYGNANNWQQNQVNDRTRQGQTADMMMARAQGLTPSIAQQQADRQMQQATAAQSSAAASARGAGGLALASQNAANNTATMQSDISGQAQINAAQERMAAEQNAFGAYSGMRQGDAAGQAQAAQQAQAQAGLNDAQRGRNDQMQQGMTNNEMGVRNSQLTGGMNQQAQQSSNSLNAQNINAGVASQNAQMNQQNGQGVLSAIGNIAGGAVGLGKARGGPVSGRVPYLVGEEGPELVIPKKDGFVIPAQQTRQALGGSSPEVISRLFDRGDSQARGMSLASILGPPPSAPRGDPQGFTIADILLGRGPRREDGGPIVGGGAPAPAVEYAPPTWGVGSGAAPGTAAWQAELSSGLDAAGDREVDQRAPTSTLAVPGFTPGAVGGSADEPLYRYDQELSSRARAREAQGLDLSDREAYEAQGADYRLSRAKKIDRSAATKKDEKAPPPKRGLADILGSLGSTKDSGIDTRYHPNGQIVGPNLLPLPGRAFGGPISAGGALSFLGGPLRPDQAHPMMGAGSGAATPSYEVIGSGGGENVGASGKAMSDFATSFGRDATGGGPMAYGGAREDGGPVDDDKAYLVGEKGSELVIPKGYDTKLSPAEERTYQAWKQRVAPNDSGEDYDYRGAFKAGAMPGEDGHWVDTFKKPNHPTFSVESQYARGADAAKAGRWAGDRFVPAKPYDRSRPFGDRFAPAAAPAAPSDQPPKSPKKVYNYDARKPFGERFVPATTREPTSFERTDPNAEAEANHSESAARINATDAVVKALTSPTMAAAGPAVAGGIGNFLTALWQHSNAKSVPDEEEQPAAPGARLAAILGTRGRR